MSMDALILAHDQELEKFQQELESSKSDATQRMQEMDNLRMTFETQLEKQKLEFLDQRTKLEKDMKEQRMSMDALISAHDQELEKFRQELESSKSDAALQA